MVYCVRQLGERILFEWFQIRPFGLYDVPRVSIVMPCDFRVWAPFCCDWHIWPRSHTTSLDVVQPSRYCAADTVGMVMKARIMSRAHYIRASHSMCLSLFAFFPQGFPHRCSVFSSRQVSCIDLFEQSLANMTKATYQNIRKLCSAVFSRKQTRQFAAPSIPSFDRDRDVSTALLFSEDRPTSLCTNVPFRPSKQYKTILDEKTPIERTYLIFDYY